MSSTALSAWTTSTTNVSVLKDLYLGVPWQAALHGCLISMVVFCVHTLVTILLRHLPYVHPTWPRSCRSCFSNAMGSRADIRGRGYLYRFASCFRFWPTVKQTSSDDCNESTPSMLDSDLADNDVYQDEQDGDNFSNPFQQEIGISLSSSLSQWQNIETWAKRKIKVLAMTGHTHLDKHLDEDIAMDTTSLRSSEASDESTVFEEKDIVNYKLGLKSKKHRFCFMHFLCGNLFWPFFIGTTVSLAYFIITFTKKFSSPQCVLWLQSICLGFISDFLLLQPLLVLIVTVALTWRSRLTGANRWLDISGQRAVRKARKVVSALEMTSSCASTPPDCHRMDVYHARPSEEQLTKDRKSAFQSRRTAVFFKKLFFNVVLTVLILIITYGRFSTKNYLQTTAIKHFLLRSGLPKDCSATEFLDWSFKSLPPTLFEEPSGPTYATGSVLIGQATVDLCFEYDCQYGTRSAAIYKENDIGALERIRNISDIPDARFSLIMKFLLYNPTSNIFNAVYVEGHFSGAKSSRTKISISPCHLLRNAGTSVVFLPLSEMIFLLVIAYLTKNELWRFAKNGRKHVRFSSIILVFMCGLSFLLLTQLVVYSARAQDVIMEFRKVKSTSVDAIYALASLEWGILSQMSFLVLLQSLLWLSVFQFLTPFQVASRTISRVWKEAVTILLLFCVMLVGHGLATSLTLPPDLPWRNALYSLLLVLRNGPVPTWRDQPGHDVGHVIYCLTLLAMFLVTTAMIKASLMNSMRRRKQLRDKPKVSLKQVANSVRHKLSIKGNLSSSSSRSLSGLGYPPFEFLLHEMERAIEELQSRADRLFPDTWLASELEDEDEDTDNMYHTSSSNEDPSASIQQNDPSVADSNSPEVQPSPRSARLFRSIGSSRPSPSCKVRRTRTCLNSDSLPASPAMGVLIRRTKSQGKGKGLHWEELLDSQEELD